MIARKPAESPTPARTQLTVSREKAFERINEQIEKADAFLPAGECRVTRDYLFAALE